MDRWKAADMSGFEITSITDDPKVYKAASTLLGIAEMLLPVTQNGTSSDRAMALLCALSVLFEKDFAGQDWKAFTAVLGRVKSRPKTVEELDRLGEPSETTKN